MKLFRAVWFLCFVAWAPNAFSSIIFNFDMSHSGGIPINIADSDTFSLEFKDTADFANGVSWSDIVSFSFESVALGSSTINNFSQSFSDSILATFFDFDDLGNGIWNMSITVGNTGINELITFSDSITTVQLGQMNGNAGPATFLIDSPLGASLIFPFDQPIVFSATSSSGATSVPEPSTIMIMLSALGLLGLRRKFQ